VEITELTVLLSSQDPERLASWYTDVLGLERLPSKHHPVYRVGGATLRLTEHSEVGPRSPEPQRIMFNLFVDDVRGEIERIRPKGVTLIREPAQMAWGGYVATLEDPDGNYVQLIEGTPRS